MPRDRVGANHWAAIRSFLIDCTPSEGRIWRSVQKIFAMHLQRSQSSLTEKSRAALVWFLTAFFAGAARCASQNNPYFIERFLIGQKTKLKTRQIKIDGALASALDRVTARAMRRTRALYTLP